GERVFFRHSCLNGGEEVSLPLSGVALFWREPPGTMANAEVLGRRLARQKRTGDQVLLRNGDRLEGGINDVGSDKVTMEISGKKSTVELGQVAVSAPSTELAEPLRLRGPFGRITLLGGPKTRGTRVSLQSPRCTDGITLEGDTAFGATLRVP